GLKELIEGTSIAKYFKQIYACSFMYENDKAVWPAVAVDFTSKTQFIFMINKGIYDIWRNAQINDSMPDEGRPVPFHNMIYFGDGETDIPSMRIVKGEGGHSIAIYKPGSESSRAQARNLVQRGRVNFACPGDYREGSELYNAVIATIAKVKTGSDFHKLERQNQKSMLEE
ncbi:MAG: haloacid dehalogenase-like hydrolase, partial [Bacteroidaceae bacterium]|nr:haloacid dehalogenase-like hydrolase [Bacteroidaceae bacterium]